MRGRLISVAVSTALAFSLTACGGGGGSSSGSEDSVKQEVTVESSSISYALTSVYSGVEQSQRGSASQREVKIYTGELVSENVKTGENKTYNWSAYVNDETFEVTSNKTVIIEPGDYHFTLNLTNGSNQYISETDHTITDRNQTNIPFNLKPVLGSVITDVSVIEEIPAMKLKYDVGEISAYSQPRVAIGVDKEIQYLDINPTTGLSDVYLAIEEGDHNITLDFYDGNQYLGRSSKYPSNVTITAKQDLNIDLVALHGEATLGFDVNESTLDVVVNIPSQVVVESEGIDNLSTLLRYSDSNVTVEKEITNLIENGEDYQGSITLEDISYGEFAFSLIFSDKNDNDELIGSCDVEPFILSENNSSVNCELSLKKRSNITGNLLATVGINVFNESMEPMAGAELYINDDYLGLTGSGDFGTEGYLKQYIKKGNYTLKAQKDGKQGSQDINLSTLSVNNFDLILNGDVVPSDNGSGTFTRETLNFGDNNTYGIALGDINGDGFKDIYVAEHNAKDYLLLNNGDKTFTKQDIQNMPNYQSGKVEMTDLDNDGDLDIYVTNHYQTDLLLTNNGKGDLTVSLFDPSADLKYTPSLKDFDNDGDIDIFTCIWQGDDILWVNDGNGSFYSKTIESTNNKCQNAGAADFDGDNNIDILIATKNGANYILKNEGILTFSQQSIDSDLNSQSNWVFTKDIDKDGDIDFYQTTIEYNNEQNYLWINNGLGDFIKKEIQGDIGSVRGVILEDFNSDGFIDIYTIAYNRDDILWLGNSNGEYSKSTQVNGSSAILPGNAQVSDLNNDGALDIVVADNLGQNTILWGIPKSN